MNINLKISEEWNNKRKSLNVSWREVIRHGLHSLQGSPAQPVSRKNLPPAVEYHLQQAVSNIKSAWESLKPSLINEVENTENISRK
jgi:hypothetical protein